MVKQKYAKVNETRSGTESVRVSLLYKLGGGEVFEHHGGFQQEPLAELQTKTGY